MTSDRRDPGRPRFGRYLAAVAVASMLAFVFLNYRDPWPPIVPPSLAPPPGISAPSNANRLSLAPPPTIGDPGRPSANERTVEADDAIPTTSLPLRLLATVVREDPTGSLARTADARSSGARMMFQGQVFEGRPRVKLVAIESDSVLIDNDGTLERLPLEPGGLQIGDPSSSD